MKMKTSKNLKIFLMLSGQIFQPVHSRINHAAPPENFKFFIVFTLCFRCQLILLKFQRNFTMYSTCAAVKHLSKCAELAYSTTTSNWRVLNSSDLPKGI